MAGALHDPEDMLQIIQCKDEALFEDVVVLWTVAECDNRVCSHLVFVQLAGYASFWMKQGKFSAGSIAMMKQLSSVSVVMLWKCWCCY